MNNKGFTLMELLVVIVILSVLGVIVTISLSNSLNEAKQEKCDEFVQEIEEGACVYAELSTRNFPCNRPACEIPLRILVEEGIVESEKDACTGNAIDKNKIVSVTWDNQTGEKKCVYNGVKKYER